MAVQIDREKLKKAYPNRKWSQKVDKMTDDQVTAVLMRLKAQNKI